MRLAATCPTCALRYEREEGYWLGAILINTVATIGMFGAGTLLWAILTWPDPPWGLMLGVGIGFNLIAPIVFYPYSKTLWVAIEITAHPPGAVSRQPTADSQREDPGGTTARSSN